MASAVPADGSGAGRLPAGLPCKREDSWWSSGCLSLLFFQESVVSLSQGGVGLSCPGAVDLSILLPHLAGVIVEGVAVVAGLVLVTARARAPEAACPKCGTASRRVHSRRYSRRLADAAIGGRRVVIQLAVRRFFCAAPGCRRKTFAEQVQGLTARYARKTRLLAGVLGSVAAAQLTEGGPHFLADLGRLKGRRIALGDFVSELPAMQEQLF